MGKETIQRTSTLEGLAKLPYILFQKSSLALFKLEVCQCLSVILLYCLFVRHLDSFMIHIKIMKINFISRLSYYQIYISNVVNSVTII